MRNIDSTKGYVIPLDQSVNVEAGSVARVHTCFPFSTRQIGGCRDLEVILIALRGKHIQPRGTGHGHIIGQIGGVFPVRPEDGRERETLGRLGAQKPLPRHGS